MSEVNKCAVCDSDKVTEHPKIKDSFYGLQYLCDDDEKGCWDSYEGWYCDTCLLLHDHATTMESDNSCQVVKEVKLVFTAFIKVTGDDPIAEAMDKAQADYGHEVADYGSFTLVEKSKWVSTPDLDISFQHCGRPAYWEGDEVYCSKCQTKLDD